MHRKMMMFIMMGMAMVGIATRSYATEQPQDRQILFETMMYDGNRASDVGDKIPPQSVAVNTSLPLQKPVAQPATYTAQPLQRRQMPTRPVQTMVAAPSVSPTAPSRQSDLTQRARAGDPDAEYQLGMMYTQDTLNGQHSAEQSYHWFTQAASKGHARAQYNLGVMYSQGEGVVQNLIEAYIWFNLAAAQRMEGAMEAREMVAETLTPDALMKAQERSSLYYQKIADNQEQMKRDGAAAVVPIR